MAVPFAPKWTDWACAGCGCTNASATDPTQEVEERYSLGIYAGRYCEPCWHKSGYRQEGAAGFDPTDAGESYDED